MKIRYAIEVFIVFVGSTIWAHAQVASTKHNLSVSGPGTIKATTEQQICVFCHTPHNASSVAQLWNRSQPSTVYTLYSSDYLTSKAYAAPSQINAKSKLCMSCHDGTIALGAVINAPGSGAGSISMSGGVTTMPVGSAGHIGSVLSDDHPVGFGYDPVKDPELINRAFPWNSAVKLDPDASNGRVECHTCHDPHDNQYTKFLRMSNTNAALCTWCHNKTGWTTSIHDVSTQSYTPSGGTSTTIGEWACRDCHKSHSGGGSPYILQSSEQNTCYPSGCHGSSGTGTGTRDIQTQMNKTFAHPTNTVSGRHKNPDNTTSLADRHAECQDCHNSHQAKDGIHTPKTNAVSGVLTGVTGVQPALTPIWSQPTSYSELKPAVTEGQICFKCHSSNAFGLVPNGVTSIVGPSGTNITDQAMEFNPANRSAHPVQVTLLNQTGSPVPRALQSAALTTVWNNPGTQTMYCSDCHGPDQPVSSTVPSGPHASSYKFMLTGTGKYWPTNAAGQLWSLNDIQNNLNNWQNNLFCANCHPMKSGSVYFNDVHRISNHRPSTVKCITCHVTIPHGSRRSRLIGYASDPPPYDYSGAGTYEKLVIVGFKKAADPMNYQKEDCSMTGICHGTQVGVYED